MSHDAHPSRFPIRELVRRSGVNASTLRTWENRRGILKPMRTPSGRRLYALSDVRRMRRLQEILAPGVSLAEAVPDGSAWRAYLRESLLALIEAQLAARQVTRARARADASG